MGLAAGRLRLAAFGVAVAVVAVGALYPLAVAQALGGPATPENVGRGALASLAPALALVVVARLARDHRLAAWTALTGAALTLALGVALYAAALGPAASPVAPAVAVRLVPLRQLAAAAVAAWAVWIVRRTR